MSEKTDGSVPRGGGGFPSGRRAPSALSWEKRARNESGERDEASLPREGDCPVYPDGSPVNECWDRRGLCRALRAAKEEEEE